MLARRQQNPFDITPSAFSESIVVHHLSLLHIASAVQPLQMLSEGKRPVAYDHVGALYICTRKFMGRWDMGYPLFHVLVESTVPPDAPVGVVPALPGVDVDEFEVCVN